MPNEKDWVGVALNIFCVIICLFILAPVFVVILNSFNGAAYSVFPLEGVSLKWYAKLLTVKSFGHGAVNSIQAGLIAVVIAVIVGVPAAYALSRYPLPFKNAIHAFLLLPLAVPKIVLGLALFILFVQIGIYGTLFGLGLAHAFLVLPYVIVMVSAAIKGIARAQEEAAMDLGARPLTAFTKVIFPQISTAMLLSAALGFIVSFDQVEASLFLVRANKYTLPLEMMSYMEKYQDPVIAALSTVLVLCVLLVAILLFLFLRKKDVSFTRKLELK